MGLKVKHYGWSWSCCRGSADAENNYMIDMPKIASIDCKCIYPKQPGQFSPSGFPDSFRWIFGWLAGCCGISYDSMSNCNFNEQLNVSNCQGGKMLKAANAAYA